MSLRSAHALIATVAVAGIGLVVLGRPVPGYTLFSGAFVAFCLTTPLSLNTQIAIGALLGVVAGVIPESGVENVAVLGRIFIAMLKMLIAPMILLAITVGIAQMGEARAVGRMGLRTVALYLLTMAFAVATGLVLVNLLAPGEGSALRETEFFRGAVGTATGVAREGALGEFLLQTVFQVLANPIASLAEGRILPIVAFAVLLGLALLQLGAGGERLVEALRGAYEAVMMIILWFLRLAPVGIFALIGHLIATVGFRDLVQHLLAFSIVVIGGTLLHAFVTLPLVGHVIGGVSPRRFLRGVREAMLVAFSTSSSVATLPVTTRCVEENLEVPPAVSSFVLPLGATVNMDGTALYEAIAAVFVANVYGLDLGLSGQLVVFLVAMLTAVGAPGIPSAGMVTMIVVLESVGLPAEGVALLLTIDRFLDTFRTMANVEGDAVVAMCVARTLDRPGLLGMRPGAAAP